MVSIIHLDIVCYVLGLVRFTLIIVMVEMDKGIIWWWSCFFCSLIVILSAANRARMDFKMKESEAKEGDDKHKKFRIYKKLQTNMFISSVAIMSDMLGLLLISIGFFIKLSDIGYAILVVTSLISVLLYPRLLSIKVLEPFYDKYDEMEDKYKETI